MPPYVNLLLQVCKAAFIPLVIIGDLLKLLDEEVLYVEDEHMAWCEIVAQLKAASAGGSGNTAIFLCQLPEGVPPEDGV